MTRPIPADAPVSPAMLLIQSLHDDLARLQQVSATYAETAKETQVLMKSMKRQLAGLRKLRERGSLPLPAWT